MGCQELIRIEPMRLRDLDEVRNIERKSFATPWSYGAFLSELVENENAHYLVARCSEDVVGYVGLWVILDEGHITNVAVRPDMRNRGIGHMLLTAITALALKHGVWKMTLEVRKSNSRAQRLYQALGYRPAGVRPRYYVDNNEDAIIMWKELTDDDKERLGIGDRDQL